jgi:5-methylcytosine-specific restriction endonuclease McrBC regulatory subunit McrC
VQAFVFYLEHAISRAGPRRDYQCRNESLGALRGTIRWADLARQVVPIPVPCRFWERDMDTPLNRLFAAAIHVASSLSSLRRSGGAALERLRGIFGHISRRMPTWILDRTQPLSRLEEGFEAARSLAIALLEGLGLAHGGAQHALAFHVDLWRLFEMTVEAAVRTQPWDGKIETQHRPPYCGNAPVETSRVDVLVHVDGEALVIDAKYGRRFWKSNLYQVLAYMKMLGATKGALVYPKGADLPGKRFWSAPEKPAWEVRLHEVDLEAVALDGGEELARLGSALKAGLGMRNKEVVA